MQAPTSIQCNTKNKKTKKRRQVESGTRRVWVAVQYGAEKPRGKWPKVMSKMAQSDVEVAIPAARSGALDVHVWDIGATGEIGGGDRARAGL